MSSFGRLFENMASYKESSQQVEEKLAIDAIRQGMNVDPQFWKNFITLLNNPESLAKLFNIPTHKVTGFYSRIKKYMHKYMEEESENKILPKKKRRLVKTSDFEDFI
jgi:hypothetical protein